MSHLSLEEKLKYSQVFLTIDHLYGKGEGYLNVEQFEKFLVVNGHDLSKKEILTNFIQYDADGNWRITLDEFLARLPHIDPPKPRKTMSDAIKAKFYEADKNNDGVISQEELTALVDSIDPQLGKERLVEYLKLVDEEDRDRINLAQFIVIYVDTQILRIDANGQPLDYKQIRTKEQLKEELRLLYNEWSDNEEDMQRVETIRVIAQEAACFTDEVFEGWLSDVKKTEDGKVSFEEFTKVYTDLVCVDGNKDTKSTGEKDDKTSDVTKEDSKSGKTEDVSEDQSKAEKGEEVSKSDSKSEEIKKENE